MTEVETSQPEGAESREQLMDNRNMWAATRTRLAQERTFNAWLRSGLGLMAFSLAIARYITFEPSWLSDLMSVLFFLIGALMIVLGYRTYQQALPMLETESSSRIPTWLAGTVVALIISLIALLLLFNAAYS